LEMRKLPRNTLGSPRHVVHTRLAAELRFPSPLRSLFQPLTTKTLKREKLLIAAKKGIFSHHRQYSIRAPELRLQSRLEDPVGVSMQLPQTLMLLTVCTRRLENINTLGSRSMPPFRFMAPTRLYDVGNGVADAPRHPCG
jgi:hypothetical protein